MPKYNKFIHIYHPNYIQGSYFNDDKNKVFIYHFCDIKIKDHMYNLLFKLFS